MGDIIYIIHSRHLKITPRLIYHYHNRIMGQGHNEYSICIKAEYYKQDKYRLTETQIEALSEQDCCQSEYLELIGLLVKAYLTASAPTIVIRWIILHSSH